MKKTWIALLLAGVLSGCVTTGKDGSLSIDPSVKATLGCLGEKIAAGDKPDCANASDLSAAKAGADEEVAKAEAVVAKLTRSRGIEALRTETRPAPVMVKGESVGTVDRLFAAGVEINAAQPDADTYGAMRDLARELAQSRGDNVDLMLVRHGGTEVKTAIRTERSGKGRVRYSGSTTKTLPAGSSRLVVILP